MFRFKKFIKILLISLILLIILELYIFYAIWTNDPQVKILSKQIPSKLQFNKKSSFSIVLQAPWFYDLDRELIFFSPDFLVFNQSAIKKKFSFNGHIKWEISGILSAAQIGKQWGQLNVVFFSKLKSKSKEVEIFSRFFDVNLSSVADIKKADFPLDIGQFLKKHFIEFFESEDFNVLVFILFLVAILLIVLAIIFLFIKRKNKICFRTRALSQLEELDFNLDEKKFFGQLNDILRLFIQKQYNIPFTQQTSKEFLIQIKSNISFMFLRDDLEQLLSLTDKVKFSKQNEVKTDFSQALEKTKKIVGAHLTQEEEV